VIPFLVSREILNLLYYYQTEVRRFFNNYISIFNKEYKNDLLKLKKILRERNAILKSASPNKKDIEIWDEFFIKYSKKIVKKRKNFINMVNAILEKEYNKIFDDFKEIEINYKTNFSENRFLENIENDIDRKTTQVGPHRDKFRIILNGKRLKKIGSQGQMKSFIINFVLIMAKIYTEEKKRKGILIFDDIFAELDKIRKRTIFQMIEDLNCQTFFTAIERDFFLNKKGNFYMVDRGDVKEKNEKN